MELCFVNLRYIIQCGSWSLQQCPCFWQVTLSMFFSCVSKTRWLGLTQTPLWHKWDTSNLFPSASCDGKSALRTLFATIKAILWVRSIRFVPSGHFTSIFPYFPWWRAPTHTLQWNGPWSNWVFFANFSSRLSMKASIFFGIISEYQAHAKKASFQTEISSFESTGFLAILSMFFPLKCFNLTFVHELRYPQSQLQCFSCIYNIISLKIWSFIRYCHSAANSSGQRIMKKLTQEIIFCSETAIIHSSSTSILVLSLVCLHPEERIICSWKLFKRGKITELKAYPLFQCILCIMGYNLNYHFCNRQQ